MQVWETNQSVIAAERVALIVVVGSKEQLTSYTQADVWSEVKSGVYP